MAMMTSSRPTVRRFGLALAGLALVVGGVALQAWLRPSGVGLPAVGATVRPMIIVAAAVLAVGGIAFIVVALRRRKKDDQG